VTRFRLLGPLEVWAGQEWREIGAPKWRAVLAVLLLSPGQVVSADALCDAVWDEGQPASARSLLSLYIMRLRRLLGDEDSDILMTLPPGYILRLGSLDTDVQLFEELIWDSSQLLSRSDPEAAAGKAREALSLWRGRPLADVSLAPHTGLENEIERLAELRVRAIELRIVAELDCGRQQPADAVAELNSLLDGNPLRENLWHLLMRVLESAGRRAEALDAYGRARLAIAEELGVDPGPELRSFHEQLLAADSANASQPSLGNLAAAVGRPGPTSRDPSLTRPAWRHPPVGLPEETASREGFGRALSEAVNRAGLTARQVADLTGLVTDTTESWCAGSGLPPLTGDGLTALRAILNACGITRTDQVLAWTDSLIRAHAIPGGEPPATGCPRPLPPVPDAPGYDLCPDPLQARTSAGFVQALAGFRVWAGKPSLRDMERACAHEVSIATMSTALRSTDLPPLRTVLAIVRGCGGTPEHQERFATAWRMLQASSARRSLYPVPDTG
jgi:DNA-binding SARP family transcriptional activator